MSVCLRHVSVSHGCLCVCLWVDSAANVVYDIKKKRKQYLLVSLLAVQVNNRLHVIIIFTGCLFLKALYLWDDGDSGEDSRDRARNRSNSEKQR